MICCLEMTGFAIIDSGTFWKVTFFAAKINIFTIKRIFHVKVSYFFYLFPAILTLFYGIFIILPLPTL